MTVTKLPILLVAMATLFLVSLAYGTPEKTVYSFGSPGSGDGMYPYSKLVVDANGNLYGTTSQGGTYNAGIVFELSSGSDGQWVETVIHEFTGQADGASPFAGIVFDRAGNLYGTAGYGGANGTGVVFVLSPEAGAWTYKVLYNFGAYPQSGDGLSPTSLLVFDKLGNLYGTTNQGGKAGCFQGCGTVFEVSPVGDGSWKERVIHAFATDGSDGELPSGGITFCGNGLLYGTTQNGGTSGSGVLYELKYSPSTNTWIETLVHQFVGGTTDGSFPEAGLLVHAGHLYGTTEGGGANGSGTVFEATYSKTKGWVTSVLYSFAEPFSGDGVAPQGGLTMDNNGNLYGTTSYGGAYNYYGAVFKLSKLVDGTWGETILHSFSGPDGNSPEAVLAKYGGWLYGTAPNGGNGTGVVYKVRP